MKIDRRIATASVTTLDDPSLDREAPPFDEAEPSLSRFMATLLRRRKTLVISSFAAVAIAIVYLIFATPQFAASTLLLIDPKNSVGIKNLPTIIDANVQAANIDGQVEVLKSQRILRQVIVDQKLMDNAALTPGAFTRFLTSVKSTLLFWNNPLPLDEQLRERPIRAAQALEKLVDIKRVGATYLIDVLVTFPDATQAANIANAFARLYIEDQQHLQEVAARRQSDLLQERSEELQSQASKAEQAVEELKFSGSLKDENSASARVLLKKLESTAQTYRVLHDKFLEQAAETYQQQFLSMPGAQIVSPAYRPLTKSAPKTSIILAGALFAGLFLGLCIILLRHRKEIGF